MSDGPRFPTPFQLARSISTEIATGAGRRYRLMAAWPDAPPPDAGFPVIYVLDASTCFATIVEGLRLRSRRADATGVGPAVVVGIDQIDDGHGRLQRTLDYTIGPAHEPALVDGDPSTGARTGGAAAFLSFLIGDLRPRLPEWLGANVRLDTARQSLFGHSMAGMFVLHVLMTEPSAFSHYVAISPSIWWDRPRLLGGIGGLPPSVKHVLRTRRLLVGAAEYDQALAPWQSGAPQAGVIARRRALRRMVDDAREFAGAMAAHTADSRFEFFAGEDHASVVARGFGSGLRFCAG